MDALKIPKRRVEVEVLLTTGGAQAFAVFLAELALTHAGPERLSDLLNGASDFIPAVAPGTEAFSLLGRRHIAAMRVAEDPEVDAAELTTIPTEHEVEICLIGGNVLRGLVTYVRPPEASRLTDFLNGGNTFFRLIEGEGVALINKNHVTRIDVIEP